MSKSLKLAALAVGLALGSGSAFAQGAVECQATEAVCGRVAAYINANVRPWASDPAIVSAVTAQNTAHAKLTSADIAKLDAGWTGKTDQALIDSKMNHSLSSFLRTKKQAGNGVIRDILVFDDKGLNVAQTDMTQDYNQGDEAKYQRTFSVGPDALFIDKITKEGNANVLQANLSVKDAQGKAIGAMTVGMDVDKLQ